MKLLLELLPKYTAHVEKHPHTLLVKFFGLYRVVPESGSKVYRTCATATMAGLAFVCIWKCCWRFGCYSCADPFPDRRTSQLQQVTGICQASQEMPDKDLAGC